MDRLYRIIFSLVLGFSILAFAIGVMVALEGCSPVTGPYIPEDPTETDLDILELDTPCPCETPTFQCPPKKRCLFDGQKWDVLDECDGCAVPKTSPVGR